MDGRGYVSQFFTTIFAISCSYIVQFDSCTAIQLYSYLQLHFAKKNSGFHCYCTVCGTCYCWVLMMVAVRFKETAGFGILPIILCVILFCAAARYTCVHVGGTINHGWHLRTLHSCLGMVISQFFEFRDSRRGKYRPHVREHRDFEIFRVEVFSSKRVEDEFVHAPC